MHRFTCDLFLDEEEGLRTWEETQTGIARERGLVRRQAAGLSQGLRPATRRGLD